jgi:hypothetical protein
MAALIALQPCLRGAARANPPPPQRCRSSLRQGEAALLRRRQVGFAQAGRYSSCRKIRMRPITETSQTSVRSQGIPAT